MSNASVKVDNVKNFSQRAYSHLMPAKDKRISRPLVSDTFTVADAIIQDAWTSISPNSSNYGGVATFIIPRSVGSIYELVLEVTFPTEAGVSICPYAIKKLIAGYTLSVGGSLIQTDGDSMDAARQSYLTNESRAFYAEQAGGSSSASVSVATADSRQYFLLDYPGGYSVNNPGTTNNHDDSYGIPFPLNKCNQDMIININIAPRTDIVTAGTSTLQPSMRLLYQAIWSDDAAFNQVNNSGTGGDIFIPGYSVKKSTVQVSIGDSPVQIPLIGNMQDGQLLKLILKLSNASQISAKNYYAGLRLNSLVFNVNGVEYYRASNADEAYFKDGNNRRQAPFTDYCQNPAYYEVWGCTDPFLIASDEYHAIDVFRQNPMLIISAPAASNVTQLDYYAVTKCLYRIDSTGTVQFFTSTSGGGGN